MFITIRLSAQIGINANNSQPDPSAGLDVNFTNKGFLPPRIALTASNVVTPVTSPAIGLLIYNTSTAGIPPNNVVPGYYYWNGTTWISVAVPAGTNMGDMLYWNGTQWINIPVGSNGQVLTLNNGVPSWGGTQAPIISTEFAIPISGSTATSAGNIIFDGGSPVTLRGVCWSTSSNPTTVNNHTTEGSGTGAFVSSISGLTTNTLYFVRAYAINNLGTAYGNTMSFTTSSNCGSPITINHVSGTVAPIDKTVTYGTVTNIPGENSKCWITSNLGADHQATSVDDATEASAGWYWQFNRKQGYKHDGTTRTPNTVWISRILENSDWIPDSDPCAIELGVGWRIPSATEWTNIDASGSWGNWISPWNSALKIHAAGRFDSNGSLDGRGFEGRYWSPVQRDYTYVLNLYFNYRSCLIDGNGVKAFGFTLRCVRDY
jgi:hypothetical protein